MGGTQSKNTADILTDISTNVSMDSILKCTTKATQDQIISIQDVQGDVVISDAELIQANAINLDCVMLSEKQNEISSKIANAIAQYAESKGQAVLSALGNTKSEVITNITNKFTQSISADTTNELNASIKQIQKVDIYNVSGDVIIKNITFQQSAKIIAEALMETDSYSSVIHDVATKIDQKTKTEEKNPIAGIINAVGNAIKNIFQGPLLIIVGVVLGIIALFIIIRLVLKMFSK